MKQTWHDLLFIHWPIKDELLRPLVPQALAIDTFDHQAWIAVVPFWMSGIRLRGLPHLPFTSSFPEINVRTYVRYRDKPGVFFLSLDAPAALAIAVARRLFHLNYYRARITIHHDNAGIHYSSYRNDRSSNNAGFRGTYKPSGPVNETRARTLDHWLTERYCLYAPNHCGEISSCEILHAPWKLQPAQLDVTENTMTGPLNITLPDCQPLLHFARCTDTLIWHPERV